MWREHGGYRYLLEEGAATTPPLVLLHGTGDGASAFLELGRLAAPGATLLSVQGNVDENGMARFFKRKAMGVYDRADLAERTAAFAGFLAEVRKLHGLEQAVGVGYSNGANLLANLLFERPDALRRVALLHPLIPFEPPQVDLGGTTVLVTGGARDPIAPMAATQALVGALQARGAAVDVVTHDGGHELASVELHALRQFAGVEA